MFDLHLHCCSLVFDLYQLNHRLKPFPRLNVATCPVANVTAFAITVSLPKLSVPEKPVTAKLLIVTKLTVPKAEVALVPVVNTACATTTSSPRLSRSYCRYSCNCRLSDSIT